MQCAWIFTAKSPWSIKLSKSIIRRHHVLNIYSIYAYILMFSFHDTWAKKYILWRSNIQLKLHNIPQLNVLFGQIMSAGSQTEVDYNYFSTA